MNEKQRREIVLSSVGLAMCLETYRETLKKLGREDLFPQTEEGRQALILKFAGRIGG